MEQWGFAITSIEIVSRHLLLTWADSAALWVDQSICIFQFLWSRADLSCHDVPSWPLVSLSHQSRAQLGGASWACWVLTWPHMVCDTAVSKCSLAQAAQIALSEVGSLHLSSSCSGMHRGGEISGDISKAQLLPSVSWSLLWHRDCVLLCPAPPLLLPRKPWLLALSRNCSVHCWGSYFHVGAAFPATLSPRTQLLSDRVTRRSMILFIVPGPSIYTFGISWCAGHPWYKLSDSHCMLQYPYFKNCSVNYCNLRIRALNWIQETQFWSASVLLSNCRWDTLVFLASFLSVCRTLIAILICL